MFCNSVDVYRTYENNDYDQIYKPINIKNKKTKLNDILIEKY